MLYPIQTQVAPEWMIQTVDESGRPLPGVRLRESWKNYRIGGEAQEADTTTDQNGYSTFPARRLRVNLLMRIIRTIINFNFHGNPGPVAIIHVLAPYEAAISEPYYEPSRPLVKRIVVRRSSVLQ